jgi:hypothetical protein
MYSAVPGLNIRLSYRFIIPRWQGSQSFKGKISFCLVVKPGIFWSLPLRSHSCRIFFYRVEKWSEAFPANCTEWPVVTLGLIGCFFCQGQFYIYQMIMQVASRVSRIFAIYLLCHDSAVCKPVVRTDKDVELYTISWFVLVDRDCGEALELYSVPDRHVAWVCRINQASSQ